MADMGVSRQLKAKCLEGLSLGNIAEGNTGYQPFPPVIMECVVKKALDYKYRLLYTYI